MEKNKEIKTKKKALIPVLACVAALAVCAFCTIGILINKQNTDKDVSKNKIQVEQNEAGEMIAKDEATLRQLLEEEATYTVVVSENITVKKPLEVNGTKTLVGDKSIIMDLNTEAKQRVLSVSSDAHLILDGATIDGNGVSSGIAVKADGILECLSGNIVYPMPYGIVTEGKVTVEDITIDRSMHTGIYVETGGELYMTGGQIKNCIQTGIATSKKAYAKVSKDAVVTQSAGSLFYNFGTLDITGGTYSESYSNCIFNKGELNIVSESDKLVEFFNSGRSIISSVAGTTVKIDGLYAHDMAAHVMNLEKDSVADVKNVLVENSGKSSFYTNGSKLTMKDVELNDIKSAGINITNKSTAELNDITIVNGGHRGIINDSSTVTMKDITVDELVGAGIITIGEKSDTTIENAKISKVGKSGIGITGGTVTAKDIEITDAAGTSIYTTTDKSKTTVDGAKLVNSGKSAIGVSVGTLTAKNVEINGTANTGVYIQKDAKLNLSDTTIEGVNKHGIANYFGTVKVKNVSIEAPTNAGILNQGTLTGEKVTINKSGSRAMSLTDASTTNVKGLVINESKNQSVYIDKVTKAHISDFKVDKSGQSAFRITKSTDVLLKSGEITNANGDGIWVSEDAKMKVQDTVITAPVKYGVEIYANEKMSAEVTAVNVTVNNARAGFVNNGGTLNGETLIVKDSISRSLNLINKSTTSITGLTIKNAGDQGVYIEDTTKVVLKEIDIDTTKGAAIRASKATNVSIKTGTIKNAGSDGVYICDEAAIKVEAVDITDAAGYGLMAYGAELTANSITVKNAKAGLVNNGGTVNGNTISIDTTTSRALNLISGSTTTINGLTAKNVGDRGIYVENSTANLSNFTVDKTKLAAVCLGKTEEIDETAVENVTLTNGTIKDSGSTGIYMAKTATANVTGVTIENSGQHGIQNAGGKLDGKTLTINQSTNRAVTMATDSETTIDGLNITGTGDQAVYVDGGKESKTEIKGFEISDSGSAAIRITNTKDVKLTDGTINATTYGIAISDNASAIAEDVRVIRQENNMNYLVWIMKNASLMMKNGEETAEDNQSLVDGQGKPGIGVWIEKAGSFNLKGGTIANAKGNTSEGAGVYVCEGASFVMDGGVIENNETTNTSGGVAARGDFMLNGGKIQKNKASKGAGVMVRATGTFTMTGGEISGNVASADGGGIFIQTSTADVNITGGTIEDNKANTGGGIYMSCSKTVNMNNATIQNNETATNGGGVYVNSGVFTMSGGTITNNITASSEKTYGAGVYLAAGTFNLNGGSICNHGVGSDKKVTTRGAYEGAGVCAAGTSVVNMNGGSISNNYVSGSGAGVSIMEKAKFIMNDGTISHNTAKASGGAMIVRSTRKETVGGKETLVAAFVMNGGTISDNSALVNNANGGGAIFQHKNTKIEMNAGTISGNKSSYNGGGVLILANSVFTMSGGTIKENVATKYGAGVFVVGTFNMDAGEISNHGSEQNPLAVEGAGVCLDGESAVFTMDGGEIKNNYSSKAGVGVSVRNGNAEYPKFTMNGGAITANHATGSAAGIVVRTGVFTMNKGATISDNTASNLGGGLYLAGSTTFNLNGGTFANNSADNRGNDIYLEGKITLQKALTDVISISPNTYSTSEVVAVNGGIADEAFAESMTKLSVEAYNGNSWYVNDSGVLAAPVVLDGVSYANLSDALAAVGDESTIKILHNQEISSTAEVNGKLTLTCDENVTITASDSLDGNMFNVATGGTLVINGATADKKITLAGGSATDYVINNNGTTLLSNVNITGGVRGIHHGAGTLGTEEKPLANVNVSGASEYGVYVYTGNVDIGSIVVEGAGHSAIYIQKEDANVLIRKAELYNSGSYGLVVKKGNVTVKNTVIDNGGISDTSKNRIGIAAHGGTLTLDNVAIKNFVGSATNNNNHGIELAGSQLNVTANETVDGGNKGLYIYNVKGHGIYATKGGMNIAKISIDGNSQTRAGIRIYASETMTNVITSASITGCAAEVQIKNTTLTIHDVALTAGSSQVQKTIDQINAMK